jgi:hypothetical protein
MAREDHGENDRKDRQDRQFEKYERDRMEDEKVREDALENLGGDHHILIWRIDDPMLKGTSLFVPLSRSPNNVEMRPRIEDMRIQEVDVKIFSAD